MADITFKTVSNNLGALQGQIRNLSLDATREIMDIILTDVRRRMHIPGTGRIYTRGGLTHQASAPGQAPAADTGGLIMSYEVGVSMTSDGPVGIIHSDHEAAAALEYGSPANNLAARPSVTPAGESARDKAREIVAQRLRRVGS